MATGYPYFTIRYDRDGYRSRFYAANDQLVWWTEAYVYKADARKAIDLLKVYAPGAPVYDQT